MFLSSRFFILLSIFIVFSKSDWNLHCQNGRQVLWTFNTSTYEFSPKCPVVGQSCRNKTGKCSEQYLCCPRTLRMSSKSSLFDRATNIKFTRISEDYKNTYRLFELNMLSNMNIYYDNHASWLFFYETLCDLFELPVCRFWHSIINCMQNNGISYAFVPLNATSVTSNISAMTILTRKNNTINDIYVCYVATKKEHRRRGLGTHLLQQIVRRALDERKNGIKHVTMHVNTLNTAALELYEKCGWRCHAYLPGYLDPEPHHATNNAYALILHLDDVKNLTGLCRDSNAIDIKPSDDEQSIRNCQRMPVQF